MPEEQMTMYDVVTPVPEMWECRETCKRFGENVYHPSWWFNDKLGRCMLPRHNDMVSVVFDNRCFIYCKLYEKR